MVHKIITPLPPPKKNITEVWNVSFGKKNNSYFELKRFCLKKEIVESYNIVKKSTNIVF